MGYLWTIVLLATNVVLVAQPFTQSELGFPRIFYTQNATNGNPLAQGMILVTEKNLAVSDAMIGWDDTVGWTYSTNSVPTNGLLSSINISTGDFTYTPNTDYTGVDYFTFVVHEIDGSLTATGGVMILIYDSLSLTNCITNNYNFSSIANSANGTNISGCSCSDPCNPYSPSCPMPIHPINIGFPQFVPATNGYDLVYCSTCNGIDRVGSTVVVAGATSGGELNGTYTYQRAGLYLYVAGGGNNYVYWSSNRWNVSSWASGSPIYPNPAYYTTNATRCPSTNVNYGTSPSATGWAGWAYPTFTFH